MIRGSMERGGSHQRKVEGSLEYPSNPRSFGTYNIAYLFWFACLIDYFGLLLLFLLFLFFWCHICVKCVLA